MYHYTVFKSAGLALSAPEGLDPQEFQRLDAIREASRTAIALDAGIITEIPANGKLTGYPLTRTVQLIKRYEINDEIQDELDPNWMYDALDIGLAA
jgi:hypothetical protein